MQDQLYRVDGRSVGENVDLDTGAATERPPTGHQCYSALLVQVVNATDLLVQVATVDTYFLVQSSRFQCPPVLQVAEQTGCFSNLDHWY